MCSAQTGPFTDGELLIRAPGTVDGLYAIYRTEPTTGEMAALFGDIRISFSEGGWITYDRYRGAVLAYCAHESTGLLEPRLFQIESDGSFADLGFEGDDLKSMATVGDGRIYLRKGDVLHLLGADNQLTPVTDVDGQLIDLRLDHLLYDPPSDSLVSVSRTNTTPCSAHQELTTHRLPLAADGVSLAGPIECNSVDFGVTSTPSGMDHLAGGTIVVSLANVWFPPSAGQLFELDPATLALTAWAKPDTTDLDGAAWVPSLGGVVLLDGGADVLRLYVEGESGEGTILPTSLPVGAPGSGTSNSDWLIDIDLLGPGCGGLAKSFGVALAGTGGVAPALTASACPALGTSLPLRIDAGVGGGAAFVALALASTELPLFGGTLYAAPPWIAVLPAALSGGVGLPGAGAAELLVPIPAVTSLLGVGVWSQAAILDNGAPSGTSLSAGLELRIG
ncbi:MAG: hypothetical protein AAF682_18440 [Planctomycetota bacterium]